MIAVVIILAVCLAISLYVNFLGGKKPEPMRASTAANLPAEVRNRTPEDVEARSAKLAKDLEKKGKEIDELKTSLNEAKVELKDTKKKLFEHKETSKTDSDLVKGRVEVERQASMQLEATRQELANALADVAKLKANEGKGSGNKRGGFSSAPPSAAAVEVNGAAAAAPVAAAAAVPAEPRPQVVIQKVIRELSDADKEKLQRLETDTAKARGKAAELEKELRLVKGRTESGSRQLRSARDDLALSKDKFRALEKRLNRVLIERDLLNRALHDLEKKSGLTAERSQITAEEIAESDRKVEEKQHAEDDAHRMAQAKAEAEAAAAPVTETPAAAPAPAPVAAAAPAPVEAAAPAPVAEVPAPAPSAPHA